MADDAIPVRFRTAMAPIAASVTVVTTDGDGGMAGVTVSTMCSLSLEPPSVIVCIHHLSRALEPILSNGRFVANVLAEDQRHIAEVFAGMSDEYHDDRFGCAEWSHLTTGAPVLKGALASFDCRLAEDSKFGSHVILIGEVVDLVSSEAAPLVYAARSFRRLMAA